MKFAPLHPALISRIEPLESRIAPAFAAVIDLAAFTANDGTKINGEEHGDAAGISVSDAGDVNGDGRPDLIIGAQGADPNGNNSAGAAYVVFTPSGGFGASLDLSSLDGSNGFKILGEEGGDLAGLSVSGAGDVNADGYADVIVGAPTANPNGSNSGASYVVFGKPSGSFAPTLELSNLDGSNGFKIQGEASNNLSGISVSGAGDVNGDGIADLLVGTPINKAYVVFGKPFWAGGFDATLDLSSLDGSNGFKILGAGGDDAGISVSAAGDVNRDGRADLIVGATGTDGATGAGYVVFGRGGGFGPTLDLASLDGNDGFRILGEVVGGEAGASVSGAGDVNGDGFGDLIIGAPETSPHGISSGTTYVVFGKPNGSFAPTLELSSLNGSNGFRLQGESASGNSGSFVSGAGDLNGDGFDDVIIGANRIASDAGAAYVVFGKAAGFAASQDLSSLNGFNGFKIKGAAPGNRAGHSVSGAGDLNGDGFDELIVGAPYAGQNNSNLTGVSYVIHMPPVTPTFSTNFKTATFTDVDGDLVTVKTTLGTFDAGNFDLFRIPGGVSDGGQFSRLNLSNAEFAGSKITITAQRTALGGDGLVNLGFLDATGIDLGVVSLKGDLGRLELGDSNTATAAATSLTVSSMGVYDTATQPHFESNQSNVVGPLPLLTVSGDVLHIEFNATSLGTAKIAGTIQDSSFNIGDITALTVTGDFLSSLVYVSGTSTTVKFNGLVEGSELGLGAATTVTINGDLRDSNLEGSSFGAIVPGTTAGSYTLTGGIIVNGDIAASSIRAYEGDIAKLTIDGDVTEGSSIMAVNIGSILPGATIGTDKIYGGLTVNGGVSNSSIFAEGNIATLSISRDITDGSSISATHFGSILPGATDGTYKVLGGISLLGGISSSSIEANEDIAYLSVKRDVTSSTITAPIFGGILPGATAGSQTINGGVNILGDVADSTIGAYGYIATMTIAGDVRGNSTLEVDFGFGNIDPGATAESLSLSLNGGIVIKGSLLNSIIRTSDGNIATLSVAHRVDTSEISAGLDIGVLTVGGGVSSSYISAGGNIAALSISGDITDGSNIGAANFGSILPGATAGTYTLSGGISVGGMSGSTIDASSGEIANLSIKRDVTNGSVISAMNFGSVLPGATAGSYAILGGISILGNVEGSEIRAYGSVATLTIAGDVRGGANLEVTDSFGSIEPGATPGSVSLNGGLTIKGNLTNSSISTHDGDIATLSVVRRVDASGIYANDDIGLAKFGRTARGLTLDVSGDLTTATFAGDLVNSYIYGHNGIGTLTAGTTAGSVKITGGIAITGSLVGTIIGTDGDLANLSVGRRLDASNIYARGTDAPTDAIEAATIGAITIAGRVTDSGIFAGYDYSGSAANSEVHIGTVKLGTHWSASYLIAGTAAGDDGTFGTHDDVAIDNGLTPSIMSRIASVVIGGHARGSGAFVAQEVAAFTASGTDIPLIAGASNDLNGFALGSTFNLRVREVA